MLKGQSTSQKDQISFEVAFFFLSSELLMMFNSYPYGSSIMSWNQRHVRSQWDSNWFFFFYLTTLWPYSNGYSFLCTIVDLGRVNPKKRKSLFRYGRFGYMFSTDTSRFKKDINWQIYRRKTFLCCLLFFELIA